MAELSQLQKAWLHLLSCTLNGNLPDKEQLLQTNPQELYQLAETHLMLAVTAFGLNSIGIDEPHFEEAKTKALRRLVLFDAERKKIFQALNQAGIWYCPLKGIILKDDYPVFGMREMTDNDILFDPTRMNDVKEIMERLSFECISFGDLNHDIYAKKPGLKFEMHRSLFREEQMPLFAKYYSNVFNMLKPAGNCEYLFFR